MEISYNKLWHKLIDAGMTKRDLQNAIKCSSNTIGKMTKNETVSMKNLIEICKLFNCQLSDIVTIENNKKSIENDWQGFPDVLYYNHKLRESKETKRTDSHDYQSRNQPKDQTTISCHWHHLLYSFLLKKSMYNPKTRKTYWKRGHKVIWEIDDLRDVVFERRPNPYKS